MWYGFSEKTIGVDTVVAGQVLLRGGTRAGP